MPDAIADWQALVTLRTQRLIEARARSEPTAAIEVSLSIAQQRLREATWQALTTQPSAQLITA